MQRYIGRPIKVYRFACCADASAGTVRRTTLGADAAAPIQIFGLRVDKRQKNKNNSAAARWGSRPGGMGQERQGVRGTMLRRQCSIQFAAPQLTCAGAASFGSSPFSLSAPLTYSLCCTLSLQCATALWDAQKSFSFHPQGNPQDTVCFSALLHRKKCRCFKSHSSACFKRKYM